MFPNYLMDEFGNDLGCSEQEHWLAVRGLLLLWLKTATGARWQSLSEAVRDVDKTLWRLEVQNPRARAAPPVLFDHYHTVVSVQWRWLQDLSPPGWQRR
jgi:hypothetical protein